jgi:Na+/H+ antiporter NhaA
MVCVGLLCLELSLIIGFCILPQFQARNAPVGHWEMETPLGNGPGLWLALIVFLGLLALDNIGVIIVIWQSVKKLKIND